MDVFDLSKRQSAPVWILDPEDVWKSAEFLKDFSNGDDQYLQLEDGKVSLVNTLRKTEGKGP